MDVNLLNNYIHEVELTGWKFTGILIEDDEEDDDKMEYSINFRDGEGSVISLVIFPDGRKKNRIDFSTAFVDMYTWSNITTEAMMYLLKIQDIIGPGYEDYVAIMNSLYEYAKRKEEDGKG